MLPSSMRIKSYFAGSIDQAMAQARAELGDEALLLNTRKLAETGAARYEVVMGLPDAPPQIRALSAAATPALPPDGIAAEFAKLNEQMDALQALLLRSTKTQLLNSRATPDVAVLHAGLLDAQVDPVLSKDIVDRLEATMATDAFFYATGPGDGRNQWKVLRPDPARLAAFLAAELERRVSLRPNLGVDHASLGLVTAFVGPTGGGKTTSLAKLAVVTGERTPVRLLSLDRSRPGASQQLQALAAGPNIRFSTLEALDRLPAFLAEARKTECVLIDTPGLTVVDQRAAEALAGVLADCPEVDVHIVVPGYMSPVDFRRAIQRYQVFKPSKLLVTKMDETESFGTGFSEAVRAKLALSFLTDGPRIPNDIRRASVDDLVALAIHRPLALAQHVA